MTDTDLIIAAHNGLLGYTNGNFHRNGDRLADTDQQRTHALVHGGFLILWGCDVKPTVEGRALAGIQQTSQLRKEQS